MKKILNISFIGLFVAMLIAPAVAAETQDINGYTWEHWYNDAYVHSEFNYKTPHSASVTARGEKTYRYSTDVPGKNVGVTLHTYHGGKKAYYNYWK